METKVNALFFFFFFLNTALISLTCILELETIAAHFAGPEKESIVDGTVWFDYKESPFWSVFTILRDTMKLEEEEKEAKEGESQSDYFRMSKLLIESIFDAVTVRVDLDTWL